MHINGNWGYCTPDCKPAKGIQTLIEEEYEYYDDEIEEEVCLTSSDSADPEKDCVFPFTLDNVTYVGCPLHPEEKTRRWCSTKTDENGVHIKNEGVWGYCTSGCKPQISSGMIFYCQSSFGLP